jgi:hypothetical protein
MKYLGQLFGLSLSAAGYLCALIAAAFGPAVNSPAPLVAGIGFVLAFGAFAGLLLIGIARQSQRETPPQSVRRSR